MTSCSLCGSETEDKSGICLPCRRAKISNTWKRQIKVYCLLIVVGIASFYYAISEIKAIPHIETTNGIPPLLMVEAGIGGFGILGGIFGLALALFFSFLHRNKQ
ncbi:MAG: hypothetical protein Q9M31_08375 [Mariprofundus sp.]|nr:hypothetical protein [Mariprofundus sp.]